MEMRHPCDANTFAIVGPGITESDAVFNEGAVRDLYTLWITRGTGGVLKVGGIRLHHVEPDRIVTSIALMRAAQIAITHRW